MRYDAGCRSGWTARARSPITRLIRRISTPTSRSRRPQRLGAGRRRGRRAAACSSRLAAVRRGPRRRELARRSRSSVVRSGTSRMKSTQTSASTANGSGDQEDVAGRRRRRRSRRRPRPAPAGSSGPGSSRCLRGRRRLGCPSRPGPSATLSATWWLSTAPERRDADRAAHRAEERDDRAGRTHVGLGGVVLHGEHEVLHGRAEAEAEDRHEDADHARGGGRVDRAEQGEADDDQRPCRRPASASTARSRVMIRPVTMLETSRPPTMRDRHQAGLGRGSCRGRAGSTGSGRPSTPNIATPISTEATVASAVVRSLNRRSGMIGSTATLGLDVDRGGDDREAADDEQRAGGRRPSRTAAGRARPRPAGARRRRRCRVAPR